ncbi:CHAT domain-containing protein [Streptomyces adonidis]|uniref:CHAT domain-containing protein n=1 Tax=Streptomyces adonidis TaxID=3231367 RepID=UPI0034DB5C02
MTAQAPQPDDELLAFVEELRARREEILDAIAATASDAPEAPELCATAGELSYRLHVLTDEPDNLELAAQAFTLAFKAPGDAGEWAAWRVMFGHVRACQFDIEPGAELLDEAWELLREGMAALSPDSLAPDLDHDLVRTLGLHLLASVAKYRYLGFEGTRAQALELVDEALRRHEAAAAVLEPGSKEAVDLTEGRGYLHLERQELGRDAADAEAAAKYYRAVLDAALPTSDLPLVRYSLGLGLMIHGRATADRAELEQAREEFGDALLEARRATGEEPSWAWEAGIRSAFVRFLIWGHWKDQAQAAAAEVELNGLLADPADVDRLVPVFLDSFGRMLYERASLRGDGPGQDRAIGLIRKAVDEWVPARDGLVTHTALFLGVFQQNRYHEDHDPDRLHEVAKACALVLEDEELDGELRKVARMMGVWAWSELETEHGFTPADPADIPAEMTTAAAAAAYSGMLSDLDEGLGALDFSDVDDDFPGIVKSFGSVGRLAEAFDRGYALLDACESETARAYLAINLLSHGMLVDPHGTHITEAQKTELIDTVLAYGKDDPAWQRKAQAVVAQTRLRDELAGSGRGMDAVLDHLARAEAAGTASANTAGAVGAGRGDDDQLGFSIDMARFAAVNHRGQTAGARDDTESAGRMWRQLRDSPRLTPYMRKVLTAQQAGFDAHAAAQRGDLAGADEHLAVLAATHAELGPDDLPRIELWTMLENARAARDRLAEQLGAPPAPPLVGRPSTARLRRLARALPRDNRAWVLGDNGITRFARATRAQDAAGIAEAMGLVEEAYELVDEGSDSRLRYGHSLGMGHCALSETQPFPGARARHLTKGIALLEEAYRTAGGPEHRLYAASGLALGRAYRTRGELRRDDKGVARRIGLDALRGHAWAALVQSGTAHAEEAVAQATDTALEVAGWCVRDNAFDEAVQALDACRGLILHAATTSRTVPERLVAAGHDALAEEWRAAGLASDAADPLTALREPLSVPSALRRRVLSALTGADSLQDRLLDPPTPTEIATALRALRKDALVYLVPAGPDTPGTAVVVTTTGDVHSIPLPTLTEDAGPLKAYVRVPGEPAEMRADQLGAEERETGPVSDWPSAAPTASPGDPEEARADRLPDGGREMGSASGWSSAASPGRSSSAGDGRPLPVPGDSEGVQADRLRDGEPEMGSVPGWSSAAQPGMSSLAGDGDPLRARVRASGDSAEVSPEQLPHMDGEMGPGPGRSSAAVSTAPPGDSEAARADRLRDDEREMGPVPGWSSAVSAARPDVPSLRRRLDRLCGWAWYAGTRPLLDVFATASGRVPRLVFVPMGALGLVPWHAAWAEDEDGRRRYALEEAEISYAASARLLCDVAARPQAAHSGAALVVGNPTGDLHWAGEEADAVQRVFYPHGRFLGRREGGGTDGPGTPQEVLDWLTGAGAEEGEGGVLHLACHASIARTARRTAHLSLHGGDLAAEELTEAVGGAGGGRLGLVLLAACRSHVSGRGHNEAYSLATAFLVAGARSVVGSLWPVPDDATSVLMFLTHHFLRTENEPPARALRRAQLWMLDPGRELPAGLPARLAERARRIDPDDLSAWAGFTHLGQ